MASVSINRAELRRAVRAVAWTRGREHDWAEQLRGIAIRTSENGESVLVQATDGYSLSVYEIGEPHFSGSVDPLQVGANVREINEHLDILQGEHATVSDASVRRLGGGLPFVTLSFPPLNPNYPDISVLQDQSRAQIRHSVVVDRRWLVEVLSIECNENDHALFGVDRPSRGSCRFWIDITSANDRTVLDRSDCGAMYYEGRVSARQAVALNVRRMLRAVRAHTSECINIRMGNKNSHAVSFNGWDGEDMCHQSLVMPMLVAATMELT